MTPDRPVERERCPVCECADARLVFRARDRIYRTTDRVFLVVACQCCRLMRLSPPPGPAELRSHYPPEFWFAPDESTAARWAERYRRLVILDHVRFVERALRESGQEGPLLDVGCGDGLLLRTLRERGVRVIGLDASLDAARVARERNQVPAVCATLSQAPFPAKRCAAVTMFHVLEHVHDPVECLRAAHRLLRPHGRLIVQVPNAASWQFRVLGKNWSGIDVPRHLFDFGTRDVDRLLDRCGFEALRHKYFSLRDNPTGLATSIAPWLDPKIRRVRRVAETARRKLVKNLAYLALTVGALPLTLIEAACRAGSTVMVEARRRS